MVEGLSLKKELLMFSREKKKNKSHFLRSKMYNKLISYSCLHSEWEMYLHVAD